MSKEGLYEGVVIDLASKSVGGVVLAKNVGAQFDALEEYFRRVR